MAMDEYSEAGMDPDMKKFFRRIINSFSAVLVWMMVAATAGLFFGLAIPHNGVKWYNVLFLVFLILSFAGLLRYIYRMWRRRPRQEL